MSSKFFFIVLLLLMTAALSGCASTSGDYAYSAHRKPIRKFKNHPKRNSEVVMTAMSLLDVDYKYGGNHPASGLDCSGFVRYVFKEAWGTNLPRTTRALSNNGIPISRRELLPGDLVFYRTSYRKYSHVGIFVGRDKFIHAPSSGGQVRIDHMSASYWNNRFTGARRLKDPGS